MERTLPALRPLGWREALLVLPLAGIVTFSAVESMGVLTAWQHWNLIDWHLFQNAADRIVVGQDPYYPPHSAMSFRWSPLMAWLVAAMNPLTWALLGMVPLLLLRDWRFVVAFLVAIPFWRDLETGMSYSYVPILTVAALQGSRTGGLALAALTVLVPRPMMLPIMAYLLWKQPRWRVPSLAVMALCVAGSVATGWADEWVAHLFTVADASGHWFMPARLLGPLWLVMLPVAGWLAYRGFVGLAALAISPYWTLAYPLILLTELATPASPVRRWLADLGEEERAVGARVEGAA